MKYFKKIRDHDDCIIRYTIYLDEFKVFYYYNNDELFEVTKDIAILKQFLKKCKFDLHNWNIEPEIGILTALNQIIVTLCLTETLSF